MSLNFRKASYPYGSICKITYFTQTLSNSPFFIIFVANFNSEHAMRRFRKLTLTLALLALAGRLFASAYNLQVIFLLSAAILTAIWILPRIVVKPLQTIGRISLIPLATVILLPMGPHYVDIYFILTIIGVTTLIIYFIVAFSAFSRLDG